jgi:glycosyltransferase involved in cell wall biosynthesis
VNGVAATSARVVAELRDRGHELQVIRPRQNHEDGAAEEPGYAEVLMRGLPIPRYPQLKMGLPSRRTLLRLWGLQRPDVVHIVTEGPLGWSALQAAQALRLPAVSDFRTNFHAYSRHYGMKWLTNPIMGYLRKFHNRTACTMVPTEALRADLEKQGFDRLQVVARGVDTQRFDPSRRSAALRASWGVDESTMVVLYVGRLAPEKNLDRLVAAFGAMRAQDPRCRLVLVGDGPSAASLRLQCPDAVFAGVQRGIALAEHYASGDVFVFPSLTETFGNVVPEAMASGLAVLAFDEAAAGQLIRHGVNGLLAPSDDGEGFVQLAAHLAAHPQERMPLGAAARRTTEAMDWERIVKQVEQHHLAAVQASMRRLSGAMSLASTLPQPPRTA